MAAMADSPPPPLTGGEEEVVENGGVEGEEERRRKKGHSKTSSMSEKDRKIGHRRVNQAGQVGESSLLPLHLSTTCPTSSSPSSSPTPGVLQEGGD